MAEQSLGDLEKKLESTFKKFPALPRDVIDLIVSYGPYLVLIGGVLTIYTTLVAGLLSGSFFSLSIVGISMYIYYLNVIYSLIAAVIMLLAFKPLLARLVKGWRLLFYLNLIAVVFSLLTMNIFSLIGPLIGFYLLFQIRPSYK